MTEVFIGQGSIFSIRRCLVAGVVFFGACQSSLPANGQAPAKPLPSLTPPTQPSPLDPTLTTPTITFNYERSSGADKGTIPIVSITPAPKTTISITPALIFDPDDLADITLTSTFSGKLFTYTFTNIPLDKNNNFTVDLTPAPGPPAPPPDLLSQITAMTNGLQKTILEKLPVNNDPRPAIVWSETVKVQVTRIFKNQIPAINPYAIAPNPDNRKKDKPRTTTTNLNFLLQE